MKRLPAGSLIFLYSDFTPFSQAIVATGGKEDVDHVGILAYVADDKPVVIEANPQYGVVGTPLFEFISRSYGHICITWYASEKVMQQSADRAKSYIGLPYNYLFSPCSARKSFYCSQLICEVCEKEDGTKIFQEHPMNFILENGELHPFWNDYFIKRKAKIPQGVFGSSPQSLLQQCGMIIKRNDGDNAK